MTDAKVRKARRVFRGIAKQQLRIICPELDKEVADILLHGALQEFAMYLKLDCELDPEGSDRIIEYYESAAFFSGFFRSGLKVASGLLLTEGRMCPEPERVQ